MCWSFFLGPSTTTETETVAKYEIMDGAPVKGESIPIRLFLAGKSSSLTAADIMQPHVLRVSLSLMASPFLKHLNRHITIQILVWVTAYHIFCFLTGYDLTATMRDVNKKFSVRYFLNLVLVDEEDRRYFKQQVARSFTQLWCSSSVSYYLTNCTFPCNYSCALLCRRSFCGEKPQRRWGKETSISAMSRPSPEPSRLMQSSQRCERDIMN